MLNSPVFIVGSPRSGTTLLQCMLSANDGFFSMPETHFFCTILPSFSLNHKNILNPESLREVNKLVCRKMEFEWPEVAYAEIEKLSQTKGLSARDFFIRLVDQFRPKTDVQKELRPIEKTPFHFRFLEQIFECFPSTVFISVVRNPLDVVSSRLAMPSSAKTPVENLANDWNKSQEEVHRFSLKYPDRMYILRYEDLVAKPEEMLHQVCRFLGVSYQQCMLNRFADQYPFCTTISEKPWKINVQIGQILNKVEVWRNRIPVEKARQILKITLPWARRHNYYTDALPIAVYQMGKVGSSSVYESLKAHLPGSPIYHVHSLTKSKIKDIKRQNPARKLGHVADSLRMLDILEDGDIKVRWKIVSLIRDPLARNLSAFFENVLTRYPDITCREKDGSEPIDALVTEFLENYPQEIPLTWFEEELCRLFDIDILASPFPKDLGYKIYSAEKADILIVKLEKLAQVAAVAFNAFLGIENFRVLDANRAIQKAYSVTYRKIKESIQIPVFLAEKLYSSFFTRHFYTDAEIAEFKSKWKILESEAETKAYKSACRGDRRAIGCAAGNPCNSYGNHFAWKTPGREQPERPAEQTPSKDDRSMITPSTGSFSRIDTRLVFLDPGFQTEFGHYRNYARQLREEAQRRGVELIHLVSRSVKESEALQYDAKRLFVSSVYISDRANSTEIDLSLQAFAAKLVPALKTATEGAFGRQVVLYMYTASPFHLPLVAEAVNEASFSEYNLKALVSLFYLDLPFCMTGSNPTYEKRLRDVSERLERLDPGCRLNICADSERTIARYAPFFKRPLTLIPVPLAVPTEQKPPVTDPNNIHLLYSGYTHQKQGYFIVKNLYDTIRADKGYAHVKFFVRHLIRFETEAGRHRIEEFLGASEGIVHETDTLEESDYKRLYEACDVVLLPYSRKYYPTQTSGALVDAMSRGRIVVVPEDTWLSDQVCRFEAGETFRSDDTKSFIDAVLKIIHNIADYRARARGNAATFSRFHSAANLFDIMACGTAADKKIKMLIDHDRMLPAA